MEYVPSCKDEEEYLKTYDPDKWKKPSVTADNAIFAYEDGALYLLLVKRGNYPYKGYWALPGGFAEMGEDLMDSAARELTEETGLEDIYLEQAGMWGKPGRDPRDRTVTALYMTLLDRTKVKPVAGDDAARAEWFKISGFNVKTQKSGHTTVYDISLVLENGGEKLSPTVQETLSYGESKKETLVLTDGGGLAFDHGLCVTDAYMRLRDSIRRTDISYGVLGASFGLEEIRALFEAVTGEKPSQSDIDGMGIFKKNGEKYAFSNY